MQTPSDSVVDVDDDLRHPTITTIVAISTTANIITCKLQMTVIFLAGWTFGGPAPPPPSGEDTRFQGFYSQWGFAC